MLPVAILFACTDEKPIEEKVIRPVRYKAVYRTSGTSTRTFSGTARSGLESKLSFKVAGNVSRIRIKVGDQVKKGALIAELDARDFQLQMQEAEAGLQQARAQAVNANANYKRVRSLYENNNASRSDLDAARSQYESAEASVRSIDKKLELARSQLSYTRLRAPFTGTVASIPVEENENVNVGAVIATIAADNRPEVKVNVPEEFIYQIQNGQRVDIRFSTISEKMFAGLVNEVSFVADESSTYPIIIKMESPSEAIRPGMSADITFDFQDSKAKEAPKLIVPVKSVGEDPAGNFVFVIEVGEDEVGTVRKRKVSIGDLLPEGFEVKDGLKEGEIVATAGLRSLLDGMKVTLLKE